MMRGRTALVAAAAGMVIEMAAAAGPARAAGEDVRPCEPPCAAGAICLNGTCLVPATSASDVVDPPAYPEPPTPYPPPPSLTTPRTPRIGGFQPVLYAGVHSISGAGARGTDPGLRFGAILGGRATELVSANGEISVDVLNFDTSAGSSASGGVVQMTFSPLFHVATASSDIVIGPRLGAWTLTSHASTGGVSANAAQQGWTLGANAGVVFPVGDGSTALGLLFSFANLQVTHACQSVTGLGEQCSGNADGDINTFSLTFAAML